MRSWMRAAAASAAILGAAATARAATDLAGMAPPEIRALQGRLIADGCYKGAVDGKRSLPLARAVKACPDQSPMLRIEAGMHTSTIWSLGADAACRVLATGSDDKTARLWSLPEGRLLRTVRLPIGDGDGGNIYAVGLSPDAGTLAAGGLDAAGGRDRAKGNGLYLVDLTTGGVRRIGGFEDVLDAIAFSPDGRRIAIGLARTGLRVVDRDTGREVMADRDYRDQVYGVAFAPDGALLAASLDGSIRRYGPDLAPTAWARAPAGERPRQIAISPDGRRAAIGSYVGAHVALRDATSLRLLAVGDTADIRAGDLGSIAWTSDGRLAAGGMAWKASDGGKAFLRRFDPDGRRLDADASAADGSITDLKACGPGLAFAASDPRVGLADAQGVPRSLQGPVTANMLGKKGRAFAVSADATALRFGLGLRADRPVRFDLAAGTLVDDPGPADDLRAPDTSGLPVTDWSDSPAPKLGAKPLDIGQDDVARALAVRPDRSGFVLGTEFNLQSFDAGGRRRWTVFGPSASYGVNMSADGRVVAAAYSDGTIRWRRWSDGRELLALFVHAPTKRWVAWTPTGYYTASPGGEDLIGWQVNRGWEQEAEFFPASRFRGTFDRPDVVRRVLATLDEGEALRQADAARGRPGALPPVRSPPPLITILAPGAGAAPGPGELR